MFSIFRSLQPAGFETTVESSEASFFVFDVVVTWSTAKTPAGGVFVRGTMTWSISNPPKKSRQKKLFVFWNSIFGSFHSIYFRSMRLVFRQRLKNFSLYFFVSSCYFDTWIKGVKKKTIFTVSPFIARASNCSHLCALFFRQVVKRPQVSA